MKRVAPVLALLPVVGVAASCSGSSRWSEADRAFVARMLPHHHLGMTLIEEATVHSSDVRLRRLVFEMGGYHGSEVATLTQWADQHAIDSAADFPGDLEPARVAELPQLGGEEHDIDWLDLMIRHHRGALTIADDAIGHGQQPDVRQLAGEVRRVQSDEIAAMEDLRTALCLDRQGGRHDDGCDGVD